MSQQIERAIAGRIVDAALALGWGMRAWDGEAWATKSILRSDRAAILDTLASTDTNHLHFYSSVKSGSKHLGWVLLVWGNDLDVISD